MANLVVMIVDDNDHMRRLLRSILEALSISQVREAANGMVALNDSKLMVPDVIITDMMMEPLNGLEFIRMLRDDPSHPATRVPVLMVTGFSEKQHVEAARDAGVTEFLAKPVTVKGVGARLESLLNNPRRFIRSQSFSGPDRRRRQLPVEDDMRQSDTPVPRQTVTPLPR
ncbi:MAG: response regulator, partial [Rhodospirillaceae bacterium]